MNEWTSGLKNEWMTEWTYEWMNILHAGATAAAGCGLWEGRCHGSCGEATQRHQHGAGWDGRSSGGSWQVSHSCMHHRRLWKSGLLIQSASWLMPCWVGSCHAELYIILISVQWAGCRSAVRCLYMQPGSFSAASVCHAACHMMYVCCTWAARYNTWLLIKLTPKGVVFPFLFFVFFLPFSFLFFSFSFLFFSFLFFSFLFFSFLFFSFLFFSMCAVAIAEPVMSWRQKGWHE